MSHILWQIPFIQVKKGTTFGAWVSNFKALQFRTELQIHSTKHGKTSQYLTLLENVTIMSNILKAILKRYLVHR